MKTLICIAYHHVEERYQYLRKIIDNFQTNYKNCHIIVDTNSEESKSLIIKNNKSLDVKVHTRLENPFFLTWQHRKHVLDNLYNYDWFYYTEDDMYLEYSNFLNYIENFNLLWPDYIPSFLRIENEKYNSDSFVTTKIRNNEIIKRNDKKFVKLDNPYHAFWIMPNYAIINNLDKFMNTTKEKKWIREIAASFGLKPGLSKDTFWNSDDLQKEGLYELNGKEVSSKCFSYHLPNTYWNNYNFKFGKLKLDQLLKITCDYKFI